MIFFSRGFWKEFWMKYRHLFPVLVYMIFYISVFTYVENRPSHGIHLLASKYDSLIPFCEYFIVPYLLWFLYVAVTVIFFALAVKDRSQYWALITNLCIGMTLFLIISLVWPNGHTLRPGYFERENIFTDLVRSLWSVDTSTNIFPSIHVFNSVAVHNAISNCPDLKKNHPWVVRSSFILCVSIVLSTMFLKQHTVIDVVGALILNAVTYHLVYQPGTQLHRQESRSRSRRHRWHGTH